MVWPLQVIPYHCFCVSHGLFELHQFSLFFRCHQSDVLYNNFNQSHIDFHTGLLVQSTVTCHHALPTMISFTHVGNWTRVLLLFRRSPQRKIVNTKIIKSLVNLMKGKCKQWVTKENRIRWSGDFINTIRLSMITKNVGLVWISLLDTVWLVDHLGSGIHGSRWDIWRCWFVDW